jgi:hypothetical protein
LLNRNETRIALWGSGLVACAFWIVTLPVYWQILNGKGLMSELVWRRRGTGYQIVPFWVPVGALTVVTIATTIFATIIFSSYFNKPKWLVKFWDRII